VSDMIKIREALLDDVPAIVRVHLQSDWDTYSALFGSQALPWSPEKVNSDGGAR